MNAGGQLTQTMYNSVGLPATIKRPSVGGVQPITEITYETVNPASGSTGAAFYRPVHIGKNIDATRSTETTISYAVDFTPATTTQDADGQAIKTLTTYDGDGRLLTSKRDGAALVTNTYDGRGNVTRTNANLLASDEVIGYDLSNRETIRGVAIAGGAIVTCRRYNAMGDVVRVWGPAKSVGVAVCPVESDPTPITDTTYDDHHRVYRVTRNLAAADGGSRITETAYNADDTVKSIRRAVGTGLEQSYVSYTYNPNGTVATTADANGNTTLNLYDGHDRIYQMRYPLQDQQGCPGFRERLF